MLSKVVTFLWVLVCVCVLLLNDIYICTGNLYPSCVCSVVCPLLYLTFRHLPFMPPIYPVPYVVASLPVGTFSTGRHYRMPPHTTPTTGYFIPIINPNCIATAPSQYVASPHLLVNKDSTNITTYATHINFINHSNTWFTILPPIRSYVCVDKDHDSVSCRHSCQPLPVYMVLCVS